MLDLLDRDYEVKTLFKLCKANADGDNLIIEKEKRPIRHLSFTASADAQKRWKSFPLSKRLYPSSFFRYPRHHRCFFASSIDADMEGLYEQDPYKHFLLVQTLSDRLAEAATEKMHEYVRKEAWGYAKEENLGIMRIYWSRNIKVFALPSATRLYRISLSTSC